jgi:hypothetical protein
LDNSFQKYYRVLKLYNRLIPNNWEILGILFLLVLRQVRINGFFKCVFPHPVAEHPHDRRGLLFGKFDGRVIDHVSWYDFWRGQRLSLNLVVFHGRPLHVDDEKVFKSPFRFHLYEYARYNVILHYRNATLYIIYYY